MRRTYQLTDETFKVLSNHLSPIAREMECDVSYINKIKNGNEIDRYAPFRELFRSGANAGAPVEIWLHDLTAIYIRSRKSDLCASQLAAQLLEKIQADSESTAQLVDAIADGHLDKRECYAVLEKLERSEANKNRLKELVLGRLGEINEKDGK